MQFTQSGRHSCSPGSVLQPFQPELSGTTSYPIKIVTTTRAKPSPAADPGAAPGPAASLEPALPPGALRLSAPGGAPPPPPRRRGQTWGGGGKEGRGGGRRGTAAPGPSGRRGSGRVRLSPAGSAPTAGPSGGGRGRRGRAAHLSLEYSSRSSRRLRMKAMEPPGLGAAATAGQGRPRLREAGRAGRPAAAGRQPVWRARPAAPAPFIPPERRG